MRFAVIAACSVFLLTESAQSQAPVGTDFIYQGRLTLRGQPLDGSADFRATLWDAPSAGAQVGPEVAVDMQVVIGGLIVLSLDFGMTPFSGDGRWLEIAVRSPAGVGEFVTLAPRQPLKAAPYALFALTGNAGPAGPPGAPGPQGPPGLPGDSHWLINGSDTYYDAGAVGVGTASPSAALDVVDSGTALRASSTDSTGLYVGMTAEAASDAGQGVVGRAISLNGATRGVTGIALSPEGVGVSGSAPRTGVSGLATAPTGQAYGVYGRSDSDDVESFGVYGLATSPTGATIGVWGESASSDGSGVVGYAGSAAGMTRGGHFVSESVDGRGVNGVAAATRGANAGVYGETYSNSGAALYGIAHATEAGGSFGLYARSMGSDGVGAYARGKSVGVHGISDEGTLEAFGGRFECASAEGIGVSGNASAGSGFTYGGFFSSDSTSGRGVLAVATDSTGFTYGGVFQTLSPAGTAVLAENLATSGSAYALLSKTNSPGGRAIGAEGGSYGVFAHGAFTGVYGEGSNPDQQFALGGDFVTLEPAGVGVRGQAISGAGLNFGVSGASLSDASAAAGVQAIGNGTAGPGMPRAAALEINNGAITVSGRRRPAGTIAVSGGWQEVLSCPTLCPECDHAHVIARFVDLPLVNELIVADSILLVTVETIAAPLRMSYTAQVHSKGPGQATVRVTATGDSAGCGLPADVISVHYQILNPQPG